MLFQLKPKRPRIKPKKKFFSEILTGKNFTGSHRQMLRENIYLFQKEQHVITQTVQNYSTS